MGARSTSFRSSTATCSSRTCASSTRRRDGRLDVARRGGHDAALSRRARRREGRRRVRPIRRRREPVLGGGRGSSRGGRCRESRLAEEMLGDLRERVKAVAAHGFTERQARFLVTVMLHSGVCMIRQYCAFAGIAHGQNTHATSSHAWSPRSWPRPVRVRTSGARIFHIHHRALYDGDRRASQPLPKADAHRRGHRAADAARCRARPSRASSWLATRARQAGPLHRAPRARLRAGGPAPSHLRQRRQTTRPVSSRTSCRSASLTTAASTSSCTSSRGGAGGLQGVSATVMPNCCGRSADGRCACWSRPFREAAAEPTNGAWQQELASPLRPSTLDELRWYFEQRRDREGVAPPAAITDGLDALPRRRAGLQRTSISRPLSRLAARGRRASSMRRVRRSLADAISAARPPRGQSLPRPYLHLSSLVGTS